MCAKSQLWHRTCTLMIKLQHSWVGSHRLQQVSNISMLSIHLLWKVMLRCLSEKHTHCKRFREKKERGKTEERERKEKGKRENDGNEGGKKKEIKEEIN